MKNPYVLLLLTVIIYAGNLLIGKTVTAEVAPFTVAFLRFCIALIFIIPLGLKDALQHKVILKKEWKVLALMSGTGVILFNALVYFSLVHTSSINAGIMEATAPIFSILLGFFFLKERLNKGQTLGVLLSLIGVIWIITKGSLDILLSLSFNIGDLAMLFAMLTWACYSLVVKKHNQKFPLYGSLFVMMLFGVIGLVPLALTEFNDFSSIPWSSSIILGLLFVGIFPSVIALLCWNKAVQELGPSHSSVFLNLVPVFTTLGAILFLGETMTILQAVGGLVVLLGVYMTTKEKRAVKTVNPGLPAQ
jgi:drug/metabolite transporter (DMT)-like permease